MQDKFQTCIKPQIHPHYFFQRYTVTQESFLLFHYWVTRLSSTTDTRQVIFPSSSHLRTETQHLFILPLQAPATQPFSLFHSQAKNGSCPSTSVTPTQRCILPVTSNLSHPWKPPDPPHYLKPDTPQASSRPF